MELRLGHGIAERSGHHGQRLGRFRARAKPCSIKGVGSNSIYTTRYGGHQVREAAVSIKYPVFQLFSPNTVCRAARIGLVLRRSRELPPAIN